MFNSAKFLLSCSALNQLPDLKNRHGAPLPEVAIVGRSNVGKSSLINHLLQNRTLARVSSTPGKTQLINFFSIDDRFSLVDLPGWGFAKVAKSIREGWGELIEGYLKERSTLTLILFLCDLRYEPTEEDQAFMEWAIHHKKPILVIFTKADQVKNVAAQSEKNFAKFNKVANTSYITYSIKDGRARDVLCRKLNELIDGRP